MRTLALATPALAIPAIFVCLATLFAGECRAETFYTTDYVAQFRPNAGVIAVEIKLHGEQLPSRIRMRIDPKRHRNFQSTDPMSVDGAQVVWRPNGKFSRLSYEFIVNHIRSSQHYDSLMKEDWALFRGDKMVPPVRVTAKPSLLARTTLTFDLPKDWSVATAYAPHATRSISIDDPERRFDRPLGWMLAGNIGVRAEKIGHVQTTIAAPIGESARRQDALSFLNWNLPHLLEVFSEFPPRLLIVSAGDPMWRGGLSGPASLFLHSDRPLISENRTSSLLHELVHVALRLRGDHESDWIVEGLAEYYSIETLRRSGGISDRRFAQAISDMQRWAKRSRTLFARSSTGPTTARAVLALQSADEEIRKVTGGKKSLDDVARALASKGEEVSLERLQSVAKKVAGQSVQSLERSRLNEPISAPAQ